MAVGGSSGVLQITVNNLHFLNRGLESRMSVNLLSVGCITLAPLHGHLALTFLPLALDGFKLTKTIDADTRNQHRYISSTYSLDE